MLLKHILFSFNAIGSNDLGGGVNYCCPVCLFVCRKLYSLPLNLVRYSLHILHV